MSDGIVSSTKNRLGQAMQDAALAHISEDIQDILNNLETIIEELPAQAEKQVQSLQENIGSLELALKAVPEQFDIDFSRKINRILDVASEVEFHTKKLNNTIQSDNSVQIAKQAEMLAHEFNRNIENLSLMSTWTLFKWGVTCIFLGGTFGGVVAGLFVWAVFPQIF